MGRFRVQNRSCFASSVCVVLDRLQDGPRGAQEAPRPPQEHPKRLQEAAKSAPGGSQRASGDPKSRPRGLKTFQDHPKDSKRTLSATQLHISVLRLEKNTVPKTIVHINVADVAEIVKDKTLLSQGGVKKRRAGGGVPPWGRQSAARPVGARATACQTPRRKC